MTVTSLPPSGLGISQDDWDRTPDTVRRALLMIYPYSGIEAQKPPIRTIEEYDAIIERGFGLLKGADSLQDWMDERKRINA